MATILVIESDGTNMIVNNLLEYIFSAPSNVTILRALNERNVGISGREVKRLTDLSLRTVQLSLANLEKTGIVKKFAGRREHLFLIDRGKFLSNALIDNIFETEKLFGEEIFKEIKRKSGKYCESIIVFGSVTRGEDTIESDLDICFVYKNSKKVIEDKISELRSILYNKFHISLAPLFLSKSVFKKSASEGKSPVKSIISEGKVISGKSIRELLNG